MDKAQADYVQGEVRPRRKRKRRTRQGRVILPDEGTVQMRLRNTLGFAIHQTREHRHRSKAPIAPLGFKIKPIEIAVAVLLVVTALVFARLMLSGVHTEANQKDSPEPSKLEAPPKPPL
jgi:hypothetical protein